jgi:hypothetical protein
MQLRIYSRLVWVALHVFGCVLGLLVLGYAIFTWAGYGLSLGPDQRLHPGAPDPSVGARYLFLAGLTLSAYCAFGLYLTSGSSRTSDGDAANHSSQGM